ncbi:organic hydroperoxide resistance protein [Azospirillum sp. SYSU D00513]|uniref:organic hydroperoxide resistance protein n=1 Tax=Azospirillum sp. SYSU D00513 TaxID=2812561 RepID=UPI001A97CDF9|nr:organic hydroperoxide resistance protein [Azospirillum sp. SYSU D00513]
MAYTTKATASGGREGKAASDDGKLSVTLATPVEMGGKTGDGTNPEQLFAAGYSACFLGALKVVARKENVRIPAEATVTATVGVGPREDGEGFGLDVALEASLPGIERDVAESLMQKAHIVCPYSHATKNSLDVKLSVA